MSAQCLCPLTTRSNPANGEWWELPSLSPSRKIASSSVGEWKDRRNRIRRIGEQSQHGELFRGLMDPKSPPLAGQRGISIRHHDRHVLPCRQVERIRYQYIIRLVDEFEWNG